MPRDELGELRARAYGPGGGLSAEEAARLRELEHRARRGASNVGPAEDEPVTEADRLGDVEVAPAADTATPAREARQHPSVVVASTPATAHRSGRARAALLAVALLGVGGAVGYTVGAATAGGAAEPSAAGPTAPTASRTLDVSVPIASLDDRRAAVIALQDWDDDTVYLVNSEQGDQIWWGTTDEGQQTCVVLDAGADDGGGITCGLTESVRTDGLQWGSYTLDDTGEWTRSATYLVNPYEDLFVRTSG